MHPPSPPHLEHLGEEARSDPLAAEVIQARQGGHGAAQGPVGGRPDPVGSVDAVQGGLCLSLLLRGDPLRLHLGRPGRRKRRLRWKACGVSDPARLLFTFSSVCYEATARGLFEEEEEGFLGAATAIGRIPGAWKGGAVSSAAVRGAGSVRTVREVCHAAGVRGGAAWLLVAEMRRRSTPPAVRKAAAPLLAPPMEAGFRRTHGAASRALQPMASEEGASRGGR